MPGRVKRTVDKCVNMPKTWALAWFGFDLAWLERGRTTFTEEEFGVSRIPLRTPNRRRTPRVMYNCKVVF